MSTVWNNFLNQFYIDNSYRKRNDQNNDLYKSEPYQHNFSSVTDEADLIQPAPLL